MYIFNCEKVQAKYRILEHGKDNLYLVSDIKKLKKIELIYYNIYKYLENERALLSFNQYNNIWKYYNRIRENIKSKIEKIKSKDRG